MKKVWKKATVLMLCGTILTTSVVYNYQTEDKNAKTANHVAKNDEKENKGQKSKWKSKTKSDDEVKLLNANVSYNVDSDGDGMTDVFETLNNMNPNVADSDGNGISDGKDTYTITYTSQDEMTEDEAYLPSVEMTATGEQLQTLAIGAVDDNPLLCDKIPGYIGHAYNFTMDGEFEQATLKFEVDDSVDMKKEPTVYYYNEETQELEELKTTVKGHMVSAVTTHFSKYILVYKQDFDNFKTIDSNGNDYLDLLCNNKLLLGISMIVSSNISFEIPDERPIKQYGDITTKYDSSYLDSIESFYEKYKGVEWRGNIIGSYRDLYCSFKRVITDKTGQKYEDTVNMENLYGTGYYRFKYNETKSDSANWDVCLRQLHNSNRRLEDMYEIDTSKYQQLKFNEMYLTSKNNMQNLNAGISDLLEMKKKYTSTNVPLCGAIVYVIGEVHDSEYDLQRIFKIGQDNNMSVYIINLGSGKKQEEKYKNAIDVFLGEQSVAKESNPDMNEINVRYYYAKTNGEFKNILEGSQSNIVFDIMEDYELVDTDHDGLSDLHEYMIGEGDITTKTGVRVRDILDVKDEDEISNENSEGSDNKETLKYTRIDFDKEDTDEDGILDGDEIEVKKMEYYIGEGGHKEISYKAIIHSDPTRKDTDGDGFDDKEEKDMGTNPMRYDITDVTLGYGARFAYCNVADYYQNKEKEYNKTIRELKKYSEEKEYFTGESYEALKNFEVVVANDSGDKEVAKSTQAGFDEGLGLTILKKKIDGKDNFIVCCRGTEPGTWHDLYTDVIIGSGSVTTYTQLEKAKEIINNYANSHTGNGAKWFVTGHSLGGRLAQDVFLRSNVIFDAGATFNGLGYVTENMEGYSVRKVTDVIMLYDNDLSWLKKTFTKTVTHAISVDFLNVLLLDIYDTEDMNQAQKNLEDTLNCLVHGVNFDAGLNPYYAESVAKQNMKKLEQKYSKVQNSKIPLIKMGDNHVPWNNAESRFKSKYKGNKKLFNNYYYAQDQVGGRLGSTNYYSRIGNQNEVGDICVVKNGIYKYKNNTWTEPIEWEEVGMCNKNVSSITGFYTGNGYNWYLYTKNYMKMNDLGKFHSINYIAITAIEPRIRQGIVNDLKAGKKERILNK